MGFYDQFRRLTSEYIKREKITQDEMARRLTVGNYPVSQQTVSNWLNHEGVRYVLCPPTFERLVVLLSKSGWHAKLIKPKGETECKGKS